MGQRFQLFIAELRSFMLRRQPGFPKDFHPQVVAEPGQKGLVEKQTGKLPIAKFG